VYLKFRSNYGNIAELTWEKGQLAMHGIGGVLSTTATPTKPTWGKAGETLESIVHQATTCHNQTPNIIQHDHTPVPNIAASSGRQWPDRQSSGQVQGAPALVRKRTRADSEQCAYENNGDGSACGSGTASGSFCRDNDTTMVTWASLESTRSLKTKTTDEDSSCLRSGSVQIP
jgi:hypothetical protein